MLVTYFSLSKLKSLKEPTSSETSSKEGSWWLLQPLMTLCKDFQIHFLIWNPILKMTQLLSGCRPFHGTLEIMKYLICESDFVISPETMAWLRSERSIFFDRNSFFYDPKGLFNVFIDICLIDE